MRIYITNINGQSGMSTAQIAQNMVVDIGAELGYRELSIYNYNIKSDSPSELTKRIDGILAGLRAGDIVIFQVPTWNTTDFDIRFMQKLRLYNIKIAVFIHDVVPLMFSGNYYLMSYTIDYFNMADLIIAPSQAMLDTLSEQGLTVKKTLIQGMWDHPTHLPLQKAQNRKVIHFPGNPERFSFVTKWAEATPLHLYTNRHAELPANVVMKGYLPEEQLLLEMSQGGFGLVWMDDHDKGYQKLYCPYKLGAFIAAGIPVIVQRGIANQNIIEKNKLGFIVDDLAEASRIVEELSDDAYQDLVTSVRQFNPLVRQGYFTRKLLTDTVFTLLMQ